MIISFSHQVLYLSQTFYQKEKATKPRILKDRWASHLHVIVILIGMYIYKKITSKYSPLSK